MIDAHCHLNFQSFDEDYDRVINNALKAGVTGIINVGTKIDSSEKAVEFAEKYKNLFAVVGIHPHHADKLEKNWLEKLEKLAKKPKVVGIGEIGMDYYDYKSNNIVNAKLQKDTFLKQIKLAHKLKLPLQIHNRLAGKEIVNILTENKRYLLNIPGMFHCMSGDIELLKKVLEFGFYIGFDGNISYEGLAKGETTTLNALVRYTPIDRIVMETDSPFLTPKPHRGTRNEPKYVIIVADFIAQIKNISRQKVEGITTCNTNKIFHLEKYV